MKTLLIDKNYQKISFIGILKLAKFLLKDKVDIISVWDTPIMILGGKYPSIVRLKNFINRRPIIPRPSKTSIMKRDSYICQYTGIQYSPKELTIDHIIPESKGGRSSWDNCVTCHWKINFDKGDRYLDETGYKLIATPKTPEASIDLEYKVLKHIHNDWKMYFPNVDRINPDIYISA